ncbi:hypothetical protein NKH18_28185 [Streptomyces sp. M10(2022)]
MGLGMLPGVGAFAGAVDPQQVALGADRVRTMLNSGCAATTMCSW